MSRQILLLFNDTMIRYPLKRFLRIISKQTPCKPRELLIALETRPHMTFHKYSLLFLPGESFLDLSGIVELAEPWWLRCKEPFTAVNPKLYDDMTEQVFQEAR